MAVDQLLGDLFFESIVDSYVRANPRFLRRAWLADEVEARLSDQDCRFVLLTGEPGVGKSAFMAQLASEGPERLRYFIRRDQFSALGDVSAHSFLLRLGYQLAARRPELFDSGQVRLEVEQRVGRVEGGGEVVGASVGKLIASPFQQNVLRIQQHVTSTTGRVVGMTVDELVIEPRLIDPADLANMALLDPARVLLEKDPRSRLVVLVDALDEIRYHNAGGNLLEWLANCGELPGNVRFVLSSRPADADLRMLVEKQASALRVLAIATEDTRVAADVKVYLDRWLAEPAWIAGLGQSRLASSDQAARLATKANGNLGYLDALARAIDSAAARHDASSLASLLDLQRLPDSLERLYALFLHQIMAGVARERIEMTDAGTGETYDKPVWPTVDSRVLGVLCVAAEPLSLAQVRSLGGIQVGSESVVGALHRLQQFLDVVADRYRIYHATVVEFLTADGTRDSPDTSDLHVDPVRWNRHVADVLWRSRPDRWSTLDAYGLNNLATHLSRTGDLARLVALIGKDWMLARYAGSGYAYTGYVSDVDVALQAVVEHGDAMLPELCRLHVARQLAITRTSAYRVEDLLMLTRLGRRDEALAHARLRMEPSATFAVLMGVYTTLEGKGERDRSLLDAAATAAADIVTEEARYDALIALGTAMARGGDPRARGVLDEAWELAHGMRWGTVLPGLAAALAAAGDERSDAAFAEARAKADRMDHDPDSLRWQRPDARLGLVRGLVRARRLDEAADVAHTMREDYGMYVAEAFREIAGALAESGRLTEAEQMAHGITVDYERVLALCAVATAPERAGSTRAAELLEEAYQGAGRVEGSYTRVRLLALIGAAFAHIGDTRAREAFALARAALDPKQNLLSAEALSVLAENLARAGFVENAREIAGGKADALRAVAAVLVEAGDERAAVVVEEVLALVHAGSGVIARSPISMARALVQLGHADRARQLAPFANWQYGQSQVLELAAEGLVRLEKYEDARILIATIPDLDLRAQGMAELAARVSAGIAGADLLLAESLAAGEPHRRRRLVLALASAGEGRLAMRSVNDVSDEWDRSELAHAVVEQLVEAGSLDQAGEVAHTIANAHWRQRALSHLAVGLCNAGRLDDARQVAANIGEPQQAAVAWIEVALALAAAADAGSHDAFTRARRAVEEIVDQRQRVLALTELAGAMRKAEDGRASQVFDDAVAAQEALRALEDMDVIASLAVALHRASDPRAETLFSEALAVTSAGSQPFARSDVVGVTLAASREKALEALIAVGRLQDADDALAGVDEFNLISHLKIIGAALGRAGDGRALEYLRKARSLCQYTPDDPSRLSELGTIAHVMAESGYLHEALIAIRPHHLDRYITDLADWAPLLERRAQGLSLQALCAAVQVAAWFYPDWDRVHAIVCDIS